MSAWSPLCGASRPAREMSVKQSLQASGVTLGQAKRTLTWGWGETAWPPAGGHHLLLVHVLQGTGGTELGSQGQKPTLRMTTALTPTSLFL